MLIALSACAPKVIYEVRNDSWCLIFDPIYGHELDTSGTQEQLEKYMDLYTYFCKEGGSNGS